jgi:subtilisin family serine protease
MKLNSFFFFLSFLFIYNISSFSQSTFFIKYKNEVGKDIIEEKVNSQKYLPESLTGRLQRIAPEQSRVEFFAKDLAKNIEDLSRIIKVTFEDEISAESFLELADLDPTIEYIQPSVTYNINVVPNDSLINEQWALQKINAFDAWEITQGSDSIVIGVIDTGIDYLHPDLQNKIFINEGEIGLDENGNDKRFNGIDDDGNGFVDDYMGWDFTDRVGFPFDTSGGDYLVWDNDPMDANGHGTFVSGILGAEANNGIGIAGVAPNVKILNLRAFDPLGFGEEDDVAAAIIYAVQMGVKVINMSFGDYTFSYILRDVIRYAYSQNVVLVGSSGNTNTAALHYPSGHPEVISVGNSTQEDFLTGSYGSTLDLVAPGTAIISTGINGEYIVASGTSASAPHVSAAAALILSLNNFTNEEVKQIIKSTADDVGTKGWDIRSGAGRLNLFKALSILAPAKVKINYPVQDFSTAQDTINFNFTIMSPYFVSYDFDFGAGINPEQWTNLIINGRNQVLNEEIFSLNISSLSEGAYTAKVTMKMNNGNTTEERINFFIQRTSPNVELVGIGPIYYGNISTILAEVYTDQRAIVKLYYRIKGSPEFDFITLDGFNTNNQFVKQLHYGFVPKQIIQQNALYEVYIEAINLADSITRVLDHGNVYFEFKTDNHSSLVSPEELSFTLPRGTIFSEPVNFLSNDFNEILFNEFYEQEDSLFFSLYKFSENSLIKNDSIKNKFPRSVGDFNANGRTNLLSSWTRTGYLDEQTQPSVFQFENKITLDTAFYPVLAADLNGNGRAEIIANIDDVMLRIYELNNDLSISSFQNLPNYSFIDSIDNNLNTIVNGVSRNAVAIADLNGDGKKDIWFVDRDGDVLSYKVDQANNYVKGDSLITRLYTNNNNIISAGDFDGDGVEELAVLFETNSIAPNFLLLVFNFKNNSLNVLYENVFLDQSAEFLGFGFSNKVFQTVKFADIDNDGKSELILNIFPYLYIFKHDAVESKLIYYAEGINSENIFAGDINQNGVTEIAFQTAEGIKFYEFSESQAPSIPSSFAGFSIDSTLIRLEWQGTSPQYYIYRGTEENNLMLHDSSSALFYLDENVQNKTDYFYKISAFDNTKEIPNSSFTNTLHVYSHLPGRVIGASSRSNSTLLVTFSEKMNNTIENLAGFEILNFGIPNSVSPANQYAYLLSFKENLPAGENKLIVKKLKDFYRSPIPQDTITFNIIHTDAPDEFYISSHEIIDPFKVKITFNLDVNELSAKNILNYIFSPDNRAAQIDVDPSDKKTIYINLNRLKPIGSIGKEYTLKIENIFSSDESGGIEISSGAGSYLVLTGFKDNLAAVYVYPNPARGGSGGKMTFANLPERAKITIFNLSGDQLFNLEETDGNGGVEFNLKDDSGNELNSGIYIYRIIRLDGSNNEVEEKIGKFAIIK